MGGEISTEIEAPALVAVVGATGVGKSSFVQLVTGKDVPIGRGLASSMFPTSSRDKRKTNSYR
jgi:ABC-type transport system involved in cytochrome bd biosynthesis fused ATPase/permease subunit